MLVEALHYATSFLPTPAPFRRHLGEAVGLWARGRRQARAWGLHTGTTATLIERTIATLTSRRTVVILGSGPLFDIPLEALADKFERVILVDQAHLAAARRRAKSHCNVQFQWRNLSAASGRDPLAFLNGIADLDWVVSVNLLSQLAYGAPDGQERRIVDAHLDALVALPCRVSLVTDLTYQIVERTGRVAERFDLLYGRPMPEARDRWNWDVAPFGEEGRDRRRLHAVAFYPDWAVALRHKTEQQPS